MILSAQTGDEGGRDAGAAGRQKQGLECRSGLDRLVPLVAPSPGIFSGGSYGTEVWRMELKSRALRGSPAMVPRTGNRARPARGEEEGSWLPRRETCTERKGGKPSALARGPFGQKSGLQWPRGGFSLAAKTGG